MNADRVDIIIRGAGLAGTSLMLALVEQGYTGKILVVDKLPKPDTQKTWCLAKVASATSLFDIYTLALQFRRGG